MGFIYFTHMHSNMQTYKHRSRSADRWLMQHRQGAFIQQHRLSNTPKWLSKGLPPPQVWEIMNEWVKQLTGHRKAFHDTTAERWKMWKHSARRWRCNQMWDAQGRDAHTKPSSSSACSLSSQTERNISTWLMKFYLTMQLTSLLTKSRGKTRQKALCVVLGEG